MSLLSRICKQQAWYWSVDLLCLDSYGQTRHTGPVPIVCRWEDVSEEIVQQDGTKSMSRAKVYLLQDVSVGGFLSLEEPTNPSQPSANEGAFEVVRFEKIPDLKAKNFLRVAYL